MICLSPERRRRLRRTAGAISPCVALILTMVLFGKSLGPAPRLADFLDPFNGAWAGPDDDLSRLAKRLELPGLRAPVVVHFDDNRIPHVFADSDQDLYTAQGYLVAADRLFQMDFIARVADGRLSEIFGERTLEFDRLFVKLGFPAAADETLLLMEQDEFTKLALQAYARGVNAYIATLSERDLPFEYKLMEARPEPWSPRKTALLQKFMAYNLSFYSADLALSRSFTRVSEADFAELFPLDFPIPAPIIPNGAKWNFKSLAPQAPATIHRASPESIAPLPTPEPGNGSNNWAVAGSKSTTGKPIVSNDVHLGYGLPSLWYEIQLASPTQNVYGAAIPGAPGVLLGFNENVAWAVTNAGTDIIDWFDMRFRDATRREYQYDGEWRPITTHEREIKVKGRAPEKVALRRTHFGPIVYDESEMPPNSTIPRGLAVRWGALDATNDLKPFLGLNRSTDFASCRAAVESHSNPAQNFICADAKGDIGIFHEGRFPVRWREQGRMVSDGSDSVYDWPGYVPREELPLIVNPTRGYVSSANQPPTDGSYPHFLGWPFEVPYRGQRINELLEKKSKFSPEEIVEMQYDSLLIPARDVLGLLLENLPKQGLTSVEASARQALVAWDRRSTADAVGASVFDAWWSELETRIWSDHFPDPRHFFVPRQHRTIAIILGDAESKWFDRIETDQRETLGDLARASFAVAVAGLQEKFGRDVAGWTWSRRQPTRFPHLARIPGLGNEAIDANGNRNAIFANRGEHGPVWKMVVALGEPDKRWAIYPGGQSGHPASRYYDNFIADWAQGKLRPVEYLATKDQTPARVLKTLVLTGSESMP